MKKIGAWLREWGIWLGALFVIIFGAIFIGKRFWRSRLQSEDLERIAEAENKLEYLRGVREEVERDIGEENEAVENLDAQIKEQHDVIRETMKRGAGMTDEEVAEEFRKFGY